VQLDGNPQRRRSVRFIVSGQVTFHTGSADSSGELVNVGPYGMLVRTNVRFAVRTRVRIGVSVDGYPTPVQGESEIVGNSDDLLAMKFLGEMTELGWLLQWLDQENVPWTGADCPDGGSVSGKASPGLSGPAAPEDGQAADPELDAVLPFLEAMG